MSEDEVTTMGNVYETPYLIQEYDAGSFRIVDRIEDTPHKSGNKSGKIVALLNSEDGVVLQEGLNIRELQTRGLELVVNYGDYGKLAYACIQEIKKFAKVAGANYVSYDPYFGESLSIVIQEGIAKVRPRLFVKLLDN